MLRRNLLLPLALGAVLACTAPLAAAETHPFSIHDMLAMDRISDAQVSPDGSQAAFVLRTTDLAANRGPDGPLAPRREDEGASAA